jgi:uncharacterized MnhB-related membrane protein
MPVILCPLPSIRSLKRFGYYLLPISAFSDLFPDNSLKAIVFLSVDCSSSLAYTALLDKPVILCPLPSIRSLKRFGYHLLPISAFNDLFPDNSLKAIVFLSVDCSSSLAYTALLICPLFCYNNYQSSITITTLFDIIKQL